MAPPRRSTSCAAMVMACWAPKVTMIKSESTAAPRRAGRAVGAAVLLVGFFLAVAQDAHAAVAARGGQRLDGALERIEDVRPVVLRDVERLVVVVAAGLAAQVGHGGLSGLSGFAG